jgi:hypothetical protein
MKNKYFVYYMTDGYNYKIGMTIDLLSRKDDLQTGSPYQLEIIHAIECSSQGEMQKLERELHNKYEDVKIRKNGEWFKPHPDFDSLPKTFTETTKFKEGLDIFGKKIKNINPRCYFYPELDAQIMDNAAKSFRRKIPWRTMRFPTNGKLDLLPYSRDPDKVFISTKKHKENLELNRFNKENNTLESFI